MADYAFRPSEAPEGMEAPVKQGSALMGILGALAGALVGAIPWFLASTFASFFVGWLGFLVGVAACCGYKLLGGKKSTRFAMVTVIVCSLLALFAAEIASWMYVLCSDPDWQADAAWYGIPVARMAWESICMPDNWGIILPNMLMGMVIGLLGIFSARQKIMAYTEPERAARLARPVEPAASQAAQANEAVGFAVPGSFTVTDKKWVRALVRVIGVACILGFGLMLVGVIASSVDDPQDWTAAETVIFSIVALCLMAMGVVIFAQARRKLVIEDGTFSYLPAFGGVRTFTAADIAGMRISANGRRLIGREGQVLARFEDNQENSVLLLQYLSQHGVGLLAK